MNAVITIALPFFALIFTGYAAGRWRILGQPAIAGLNAFVYYFALPALLIIAVSQADIAELFDPRVLAGYYGAGLTIYLAAAILGRIFFPNRLAAHALQGLTAVFSNVGYIGLPLVIAAFGVEATAPAVTILLLDNVVVMGITILFIEADLGRGQNSGLAAARTIATGILRNPLMAAVAVGIVLSATGTALPAPIKSYGDLLGSAAAPCALFALGATLVGRPISQGIREVGYLTLFKLVIHPLAVFAAVTFVVELPPLWVKVLLLEASLPVAASVFVLAQQYEIYTARTSTAVLASSVLSVVTVSIMFTLLQAG